LWLLVVVGVVVNMVVVAVLAGLEPELVFL
jgi:hypothetical protein